MGAPAVEAQVTSPNVRVSAPWTWTAAAEVLFAAGDRSSMMAVNVTFEPGAHTVWHNHPAGQYLIVTSGSGWMQQRGGKKLEIKAGDVVWTPPGGFHWHGATTNSALSHLAVWQFVDGSGGEVGERVTDEVYLAEVATD